jgi:hypothetical protein
MTLSGEWFRGKALNSIQHRMGSRFAINLIVASQGSGARPIEVAPRRRFRMYPFSAINDSSFYNEPKTSRSGITR